MERGTIMKKLIMENRTSTTALKSGQFANKDAFTNWKYAVETLRLKVSDYAVLNRQDASHEAIDLTVNEVYASYNKVLSFFTNKSLGEKVKAQASDLNSLLTMIGKSTKDGDNGKKFLPVGTSVFRKAIEDFIVDRINAISYMTAEDIETEKKARNEAKKAAKKAKKEAEAAEKNKAEQKAA